MTRLRFTEAEQAVIRNLDLLARAREVLADGFAFDAGLRLGKCISSWADGCNLVSFDFYEEDQEDDAEEEAEEEDLEDPEEDAPDGEQTESDRADKTWQTQLRLGLDDGLAEAHWLRLDDSGAEDFPALRLCFECKSDTEFAGLDINYHQFTSPLRSRQKAKELVAAHRLTPAPSKLVPWEEYETGSGRDKVPFTWGWEWWTRLAPPDFTALYRQRKPRLDAVWPELAKALSDYHEIASRYARCDEAKRLLRQENHP